MSKEARAETSTGRKVGETYPTVNGGTIRIDKLTKSRARVTQTWTSNGKPQSHAYTMSDRTVEEWIDSRGVNGS